MSAFLDAHEALLRLRLLVRAAEEVAVDPQVTRALETSTGLSAAGVALALERHLERAPSASELEAFVRNRLPEAPEVRVILAANVFVAALRAIAVAAVSGARVLVCPSRREPVFARALVLAAQRHGATWLELAPATHESWLHGVSSGAAVHVYGRDETVRAVQSRLPAGVSLSVHGPGFSAAWVARTTEVRRAAELLARDIVPFDQRGCLSPRIVFVAGDVIAFAAALAEELSSLATRVPRGHLDADELAAWTRHRETWRMAADAMFEGPAHLVTVAEKGGTCTISPVGRAMHVLPVDSFADAQAALWPFARDLVALASEDDEARLDPARFGHVRQVGLGTLQRVPFDGPVDLRGSGLAPATAP